MFLASFPQLPYMFNDWFYSYSIALIFLYDLFGVLIQY